MRTVPFQSVLNGVAFALGLNPSRDLNPARAATFAEYVNRRVEKGWRFDFWPEWTLCEARGYRLAYNNATAYPAPTAAVAQEVFFPGTVGYFQALQATTGVAPATLVGGQWLVNGAQWALSLQNYGSATGTCGTTTYTGPDWMPNTVYTGGAQGVVGATVRNPNDNRFYMCFVSHTSGATFDATKFGILTPFNKYIAYDQAGQTSMDEVKRVCKRNPRVFPKTPGEIPFNVSSDGVQLQQSAPALVWVEFRKRPPVFTSTVYNAATAYAAGALVLSTITGECYLALQPATGQDPTAANSAYWNKIDFPRVLSSPVKRFALADAYRDQKQNDRADDEEERANEELQNAWDEVQASQGQYETAKVETYGS